ncbi:unnamed protein product, partial [Tetraodon nigroviridis]
LEQRLLLQYLVPLGDHQELLAVFMRMDTCSLLRTYVRQSRRSDLLLTFDALLVRAPPTCRRGGRRADWRLCPVLSFWLRFCCTRSLQPSSSARAEWRSSWRRPEGPRPPPACPSASTTWPTTRTPWRGWASPTHTHTHRCAHSGRASPQVCVRPGGVLSLMVSYALRLLESGHASGVCHATMFFCTCFCLPALLQLFDQQDGLRTLVNLISTLEILRTENQTSLNEGPGLLQQTDGQAHLHGPAQAYTYTREQVAEMMDFLLQRASPQPRWEPVETFLRLDCVPLLLRLLSSACDWRNYSGRNDTDPYALDVLAVLTLLPKVPLLLGDTVVVLDQNGRLVSTPGMSILLGLAEGHAFANDAEIQKSALQVIINCVCAPD